MKKVVEKIDAAIIHTWTKKLSTDYDKSFLLKEDSLKNAFYFHLRTALGDSFFTENNLRMYTEFHIHGERIDLAIVEINPKVAESTYLEDSVKRVLIAIEMKYKHRQTREHVFYDDVQKTLTYLTTWGKDTNYYLAFIHEKYYSAGSMHHWVEKEERALAKDRVTELFAFWDEETDETVWTVTAH